MKSTNKLTFCFLFSVLLLLSTACNKTTTNDNQLKLWYQQPAQEWMQATPVGNGRIGAMIYGGVDTETIALNEVTLWSGQYDENQEIPCGKAKLTEMRKLFFEGNLEEGNRMGAEYLSGRPNSFGTNLPFGDLKIDLKHESQEVSNYKRELDIEKSVTTVTYDIAGTTYTREYICSNPDDVLLIKLTSSKKDALNMEVGLDLLRESDISTSDNTLTFSGQALFPKLGPGGVYYVGNIHVAAVDGKVTAKDKTIQVENGNEVVITIDLRTDFKNPSYKTLCDQTIQNATKKSYDDLKNAHVADYTNLFKRTELFLGSSELDNQPTDVRWKQLKETGKDDPGLFALFFQYGRYLLISSSRENSPLPAHLQGIWNDNLACNMPWTCDYHLDINTEQNYWLANVGNLHECNAPLFSYLKDLSEHGEKTAMKVYGSPGWTAHTVANVWGYTAPGQGVTWGMFPTAGAWLASHLWSHYCYTQDKDFLRNKAYPILKKSAVFLLDFLVENPNDGYLITGPSISPENSFKVDGREYALSMMPTCDRVLVYEAFESCIEASKILGLDAEFRASLEKAMEKLPPIKIGKDGTVQEWYEDYDLAHPNHRHSSHLLSLYPYHQITLDKTPELAEAAAKSVYRQLNSENWEDVEWSRANMVCFYARLKNAEEAYKNMKGLLVEFSRENLFTMSPAGIASAESDIFSFDANEAAPTGMAEMLIQSHEGYIEFLPTLPKEWNTGYFKGLCVRGGADVDLEWKDGIVQNAKITATTDNSFSVKLPSNNASLKVLKNGKSFSADSQSANVITVQLNKGDYLEFTSK
ncbi:glycoside hydrolase N-terminal domain-containing protein [Dysgonomonas sp. 520]|uniref:glycoside hydrolase family 95 protein n=1 Tax=Dysgonomonas sp. 520 TaxID=2302931 RepID=UPI0013D21AF9|nr:glycoside hydrolase family 95 protein [Dysgonomonas sp. 520]NDW08583.1 glycoside hydrolase family 95 protein [Dysgonomonas sp. 520]